MAHRPHTVWPMKKKMEVVATYLLLGKNALVEAVTGVDRNLIRQWRLKPWWKEIEDELRNEEVLELDAKLRKIVDKSLDTVMDRVENGDFVLDMKSGKIVRRPVNLKDVHKVSIDLIDKRLLIQGRPTRITENVQTTQDHLKLLAQQFSDFVTGKREEKVVEGETIEQETINAIPDKRQEGLQERGAVATEARGDSEN